MTIIGIVSIRYFRMFINTVNKESTANLILLRRKPLNPAQFATCPSSIFCHSRQANSALTGPNFRASSPKFCTGPLICTSSKFCVVLDLLTGGGRVRNAGLPVITGNTLLTVACEYCRRAPSAFGCPRGSRVQPKQGSDSSRRARNMAANKLKMGSILTSKLNLILKVKVNHLPKQ